MTKSIVCDHCGEQIKFRKDLAVVFILPKVHTYHRECYKNQKVKMPRFFKNRILINGILFNLFSLICPILIIPVFYMNELIDQLANIFVLLSFLIIRATSYFKIERHLEK